MLTRPLQKYALNVFSDCQKVTMEPALLRKTQYSSCRCTTDGKIVQMVVSASWTVAIILRALRVHCGLRSTPALAAESLSEDADIDPSISLRLHDPDEGIRAEAALAIYGAGRHTPKEEQIRQALKKSADEV